MVGAAQEGHGSPQETHAAGEMQWGVALTVTDQRVGVSLEQVLDHLVLLSQHRQVEGRLTGQERNFI